MNSKINKYHIPYVKKSPYVHNPLQILGRRQIHLATNNIDNIHYKY